MARSEVKLGDFPAEKMMCSDFFAAEKIDSDFDVSSDKKVPDDCSFSILVAAASELAWLLRWRSFDKRGSRHC